MTEFTAEELFAGERMFASPCRFVRGAPAIEHLPPADRPEIAFAGRSNVGKSSLINAIARHSGLARASNTPGRTQDLNFFAPSNVRAYLVDMPGYGFAEAPKDKVEAWTALVRAYLAGRPTLARVLLLIDSRRGVMAGDTDVMGLLDTAAVAFQVVLTKSDKIPVRAQESVFAETRAAIARHPAAFPVVLATSAEKGSGIAELRATIAAVLASHGA